MKYFYRVWRAIKRFFVVIWNILSLFFGVPYEEQSKKIKLDENDADMRGSKNIKTNKKVYRANKVSK